MMDINLTQIQQIILNTTQNTTTKTFVPNPQKQLIDIVLMILSVLKIINIILMIINYVLLLFQTIYILKPHEPKYINLRNIAVKWIICLIVYQFKQRFVSLNHINHQIYVILMDLVILAFVYPSKILKIIHLKYFSHKEQQKFQQSVTDPNKYDLTLSSKFFITLCVLLLNFCKYLITLVLPQQRQPIQQVLRSINAIVIDHKYFWELYNTEESASQQQAIGKEKLATRDYLMSGSSLSIPQSLITSVPSLNLKNSQLLIQNQSPRQNKRQIMEVINAYGQKCSNITSNGYRPIKRVSIKYTISTSWLQIIDLSLGRSQIYILQELTQKQEDVVQFLVLTPGQKVSEQIYIKFKNSNELETFMREIQMAERTI